MCALEKVEITVMSGIGVTLTGAMDGYLVQFLMIKAIQHFLASWACNTCVVFLGAVTCVEIVKYRVLYYMCSRYMFKKVHMLYSCN